MSERRPDATDVDELQHEDETVTGWVLVCDACAATVAEGEGRVADLTVPHACPMGAVRRVTVRWLRGGQIRTVFAYRNGQVLVTDRFGRQLPEYMGHRDEVLARICRDALADAIFCGVRLPKRP